MHDIAYRVEHQDEKRRGILIGLLLIAIISITGAGYAVYQAARTDKASVACELAMQKLRDDVGQVAAMHRDYPWAAAQLRLDVIGRECVK